MDHVFGGISKTSSPYTDQSFLQYILHMAQVGTCGDLNQIHVLIEKVTYRGQDLAFLTGSRMRLMLLNAMDARFKEGDKSHRYYYTKLVSTCHSSDPVLIKHLTNTTFSFMLTTLKVDILLSQDLS